MAEVRAEISMSLDGFVAGPNQNLEQPLGAGGELLHEWAFPLKTFREMHGREGGETGPDDELMAETVRATGAEIMGRRMFSGGEGPWEDDPNADGWWGDNPPFHTPVFVLTHHAREPLVKQGGTTFTFVTDGIESAHKQAREAAGGKDVAIGGGASAIQQAVNAGLVDELLIHAVPVLLGAGARLFDGIETIPQRLELSRHATSPTGVAHLTFSFPDGS
ncbi:MAG: dihydrofolate reductase family protein [Actinomycetota bacterium]|nr:dihydrofolate reductase family protein [Actinomycetota bacterium]